MYKPDQDSYDQPLRTELKRDYSAHVRQDDTSSRKSLFQEYQYLTPGTFHLFRQLEMRMLTIARLVYVPHGLFPLLYHPVRRSQGSPELGGPLRGFREGHVLVRAKETAVIWGLVLGVFLFLPTEYIALPIWLLFHVLYDILYNQRMKTKTSFHLDAYHVS